MQLPNLSGFWTPQPLTTSPTPQPVGGDHSLKPQAEDSKLADHQGNPIHVPSRDCEPNTGDPDKGDLENDTTFQSHHPCNNISKEFFSLLCKKIVTGPRCTPLITANHSSYLPWFFFERTPKLKQVYFLMWEKSEVKLHISKDCTWQNIISFPHHWPSQKKKKKVVLISQAETKMVSKGERGWG